MAESTENIIPNKKNNQKNVVTVPQSMFTIMILKSARFLIQTLHQLSQAQQKNLEVVHHQDDEIVQADDNLNKSHEFVGLPCQDKIVQADDNLNKSHEFVGLPCQDIKATRKKKRQLSVCDIIEPGKKLAFNQVVILLQLFIIKKMKYNNFFFSIMY
ncbi:hypothetical protein TNCV_2644331 [Trichonephila clavipes]|nr:hypothetical protein TNCV_2644331 [Trichonephila clavipes]